MAVKIPQALKKILEDKAEGAYAHIDKLAKRFLGVEKYPYRQPNEKRVIVRIGVERISGYGWS